MSKPQVLVVLFILYTLIAGFKGVIYAQPSPYKGDANACITGAFYDSVNRWYAYPNNCTDTISVRFVSRDGLHSGTLDIPHNRSGNTGWSEREINQMGGLEAYSCPEHYYAVDKYDKMIFRTVTVFRCKYRGY